MREGAARIWLLSRRTYRRFSDDNCTLLGAAISYYVLFSLVPLAIFFVSIFGFVVRDASIQDRVIQHLVDTLPLKESRSQELVGNAVRSVRNASGPLAVVGILGSAWSASAMFSAVRRSLNVVWGVERDRPVVQQKLVDLAMIAGLGLVLVASVAGTATLSTLRVLSNDALGPLSTNDGFVWTVLPLALPSVLTFTVFLLIYRFVPHVTHSVRDVWPGALLATVLFELLKNGFALYVANFQHYDLVYGSLGVAFLFLIWMYLSANFLLLGGELAVECERLAREPVAANASGPARSVRDEVRRWFVELFVHGERG